jgi:hypothetical protein
VSDLTAEMRQLAADAAQHARPLAIAEVIRRGNRRRTRTIAQRSIGGLSAVGLGAAVLFTGVTHHPAGNPAASGATASGNTVTVTQTSASGHLVVHINYQIQPKTRDFKLVSMTYSGAFAKTVKHPQLQFIFGPGLDPGKIGGQGIGFTSNLQPGQVHHFSGKLNAVMIRIVNKHGVLGRNGSVSTAFQSFNRTDPHHAVTKRFLIAIAILTG